MSDGQSTDKGRAVHSPLEAAEVGDAVPRVVRRRLAHFAFTKQMDLSNRPQTRAGQKAGSSNKKGKPRTHPPLFTFSRARSTAGCQIPFPRNVSMTCPFRKNAESVLESLHKVPTPPTLSKTGTHGLVKQMSAAPIDQRVVLESKYVAVGRTPHITGSSNLTDA